MSTEDEVAETQAITEDPQAVVEVPDQPADNDDDDDATDGLEDTEGND